MDGKTFYDQRISPERAEKLKEDILRFRMDTVMEGVDACFFRPDGVQTETMRGDPLDSRPERLGFGEELVGSVLFDQ